MSVMWGFMLGVREAFAVSQGSLSGQPLEEITPQSWDLYQPGLVQGPG